jgi:two-component system phosphate regulon response regulator PhoB
MSKGNIIKILVVEDDKNIAEVLKFNLTKAGYQVTLVRDGDRVMDYAINFKPDLILLDWVLPGLEGVNLCKIIRQNSELSNIPILMISSKDDEIDKVSCLNNGADDYITKPIAPIELLARIKALLRRYKPILLAETLEYQGLVMDLSSGDLTYKDKKLTLPLIQYKILQSLMEYPNKIFSRDNLIDRINNGKSSINFRTIDVHIARLRANLEIISIPITIKTMRGLGYKLQ